MRKVWVVVSGMYRVPFRSEADAKEYVRVRGGIIRTEWTAMVKDIPAPFNREREEIEQKLKEMLATGRFRAACAEFDRMLRILGNVDGNEIVALALVAFDSSEAKIKEAIQKVCTYPDCECFIVSTSSSQPEPQCPLRNI